VCEDRLLSFPLPLRTGSRGIFFSSGSGSRDPGDAGLLLPLAQRVQKRPDLPFLPADILYLFPSPPFYLRLNGRLFGRSSRCGLSLSRLAGCFPPNASRIFSRAFRPSPLPWRPFEIDPSLSAEFSSENPSYSPSTEERRRGLASSEVLPLRERHPPPQALPPSKALRAARRLFHPPFFRSRARAPREILSIT